MEVKNLPAYVGGRPFSFCGMVRVTLPLLSWLNTKVLQTGSKTVGRRPSWIALLDRSVFQALPEVVSPTPDPTSPYTPRLMNLVRQFLRLKVIALHLGGFYMLEAAERELIGL